LEVQYNREPERREVSYTGIVHEVLSSIEARLSGEHLKIIDPEDTPEDLSQVKGVVIQALE
jgi:hypothetical protein